MTRHSGGLQLLAGTNVPAAVDPSTAEVVRLFDMLVTHLLSDLSTAALVVAQTDVVSLWSAGRIRGFP